MTEEIRLGTIGSGNIVKSILENVAVVDGIRLEAVYSRSQETGRDLAGAYGASKVYTEMDAFLRDEEVNFVYIATPNILHYVQAKKALLAGKNVICEKPFCTEAWQAAELMVLAEARGLFLIDAVPTAFLPNLEILKEQLQSIGRIRLVLANYSQYSSRYDLLLKGEIPNVFNPEYGGGCLMDINFYNVYLNIVLFGKPGEAVYYPNRHGRLADTSGILIMQYDDFISQSAGAKDTWGVNSFQIEGESGYIYIKDGSNGIAEVKVVTKDGEKCLDEQGGADRCYFEVLNLTRMVLEGNRQAFRQKLDTTLKVMEVLENARKQAGILFPGDKHTE